MFFETMLTKQWIDEMAASGLWTDEHLFDRFRSKAVVNGNSPLIIDRQGQLSWADAARIVDDLSRGFLEIGVGRADVVQLQLPNRREFVLCVLALERIGAVVNPVAPIFRSNEVTVMSELARPVAVVTVESFRNFDLAGMHLDLREQCPWVKQVIVVPTEPGTSAPADTMSWDDIIATGQHSSLSDQALDLLRPEPNDVCEIIFTSGTTGQPKGVMHTQNTMNAAADVWLNRIAPDCTVFHMASTLAHQTGYLYGIRTAISAGGRVVYQEVWDAVEFAELIEVHGIEASMGATPFLADLMAVDGLEQRDLSSFKAFVCAGATIPLPVLEQARDTLPCTVMPGWGMTEMGLATSGRRDDPFEKLATDGFGFPDSEVRVVDDDGQPVSAGEEGDLQYRGSLSFVGYAQGRELSESCWRDGWFDTGDRAIVDNDGYIKISGRTKDIVIRGGENIPVKEVEDVLIRHPSVVNCAIVGKPHDRLGEVSCAVILATGKAPNLAELTVFLEEQKVTRQFWPEALRVVDEFPMTPSGKIQKYKLRDLVTEDA
ncbi:MAG: cyclohexanecarboxylate-CoA ligase [Acidimicrobiales bacterium]